jgi:hypothetical protein
MGNGNRGKSVGSDCFFPCADSKLWILCVMCLRHALCWVHAERLIHKLDTFNDPQRSAQQRVRGLVWDFYASLKAYRLNPDKRQVGALRARFDRIFRRRTGFATLDRLLARLHSNKTALLMVLERPEIQLHTNGSENDIRCYITRRKVSAGTRSSDGRDSRDAFLGLAKTCDKLGIPFWDYLGSRLKSQATPPSARSISTSGSKLATPDRHRRQHFCPCYSHHL